MAAVQRRLRAADRRRALGPDHRTSVGAGLAGGRILRFVLTPEGRAEADARDVRSAPLIAAIVARREEPEVWAEAGRCRQRLALPARALRPRTAFISQPVEVRRLRPRLDARLGLRDETTVLLLRVGFGPEAPFSLRRPVEEVIVPA